MAEATETCDGYLIAFFDGSAVDGGVCGDASAEQRRDTLEVCVLRDGDGKASRNDKIVGVSALGFLIVVEFVDGAVGENDVFAVLFHVVCAFRASATGANHATDTGVVTYFELSDIFADLSDDASDFVSRDNGVERLSPVAIHVVDIAMADASVEDFNQDIVITDRATIPLELLERAVGVCTDKTLGRDGVLSRDFRERKRAKSNEGGEDCFEHSHRICSQDIM